jgi:hypothetical protein
LVGRFKRSGTGMMPQPTVSPDPLRLIRPTDCGDEEVSVDQSSGQNGHIPNGRGIT